MPDPTPALFSSIDSYLSDHLLPPDPILDAAISTSAAAGLPQIHVSPTQGKLLHLLALLTHSQNILEIGTLAAYSTIWLARALPPTGHLITLESNPKHADVARANLARANLSSKVELLLAPALDSLSRLSAENRGPFDLIFIDADKPSYPAYLDWSLKLSRPGTLIIADNIVRKGAVLDANSPDPNVQGARQFLKLLSNHPRLLSTAIQTVGQKGHDGLSLSLVTGSTA